MLWPEDPWPQVLEAKRARKGRNRGTAHSSNEIRVHLQHELRVNTRMAAIVSPRPVHMTGERISLPLLALDSIEVHHGLHHALVAHDVDNTGCSAWEYVEQEVHLLVHGPVLPGVSSRVAVAPGTEGQRPVDVVGAVDSLVDAHTLAQQVVDGDASLHGCAVCMHQTWV